MKTEEFVLNNTLSQLNIEKTNINKLGIILDDIDKKTKNIKRGDAQLNNLLVYNGTDWVPSGGSDPVTEAQDAASESLASKTTAQQQATDAATSATDAATSAANASTSATNAATSAVTSAALETQSNASATSAHNDNTSVSTALSLINTKANSNNPTFTGTVQLPSGTTLNGNQIALSDKIMTSACFSADSYNQNETLNDTEVLVEFNMVHKNNTGTPSMGSTSSLTSSTLWNESGSRKYFKVPANKGGIYEISTQVTIDAGYNGNSSATLANGTDHVIRVNKRTGSVDTLIMENRFNLCERPGVSSTRETSYDIVSRKAKDIVYLDAGDEIWAAVKVIVIDASYVVWRIKGGPTSTFLHIREVEY